MFSSILSTKFFIPPHRPENISRSRLNSMLDGNEGQRVFIINAPAGFGKTTLVSDWLHKQDKATAWISIDESDNDPQRFFTYLIMALLRPKIIPDQVADKLIDLLESTPLDNILTNLINHITRNKQESILILDDYHLVDSPTIHSAITFLLHNTPHSIQFVILTRINPPLKLAKLRAKNQLVMLTAADLRFTKPETEGFLNDTMKLGLTQSEIEKLDRHTEGWVTALQLAAYSLKRSPRITDFFERIAESDQYIAEYLVDEVIAKEPASTQEFLTHTSILKKMCPDICNRMLGIDNAQKVLEELRNTNLFITPLDNNFTWYRYHNLFAELLQRYLQSKSKAYIQKLHLTAADWFQKNEFVEEAIEHLIEAEDYDRVIQHIDKILDEILGQAKFGICTQWLNRIPDSYFIDNPIVVLHQAFFLYEMGEFEKCYQRIAFAEDILGPEPDNLTDGKGNQIMSFGCLNAIKGVIHSSQGEVDQALKYATRAFGILPEEPTFWKVLSLTTMAFCQRIMRNYPEAITKVSMALKLASEAGFIFLYFMSTSFLSKLQLERGLLFDAIDTCRKALEQDARSDYKIPFTGLTYVLMGELLYITGELESADDHIKRGLESVTLAGAIYSISRGKFLAAKIKLAKGNSEAALQIMDELNNILESLAPTETTKKVVNTYRTQIQILCNQFESAREWAQQPNIERLEGKTLPQLISLPYLGTYRIAQDPLDYHVDLIRYTLARFQLVTGQYEKALANVEKAFICSENKGRTLQSVRFLILKALILEKLNDTYEATDVMLSAFKLVNPKEISQIYIDEGAPLLVLVKKINKLLILNDDKDHSPITDDERSLFSFILELLIADRKKAPFKGDRKKQQNSYYELTPREIEVLAWLSKGYSYDETSAHLHISKNTVKTHLRRIYSKLDVSNRQQAVNKAKEIGLIN
jgi:LuxR family transcriptional regulator, maltose regulon positive regulatory protein